MMALVPSDTIYNTPNPAGMTPGVVFVGGTYGMGEEGTVVVCSNDTTVDLPIAEHVAPDMVDVTAMIAQEVEHRVRQREMNQTRMLSLINGRSNDIVVADEVRDESTPGGEKKKRRRWVMAMITLSLLVVVGGLGGLLYGFLMKEDKDKPVGGSEESPQRFVRTQNPGLEAPPSLSPVSLDMLMEELKPWIAPTETDAARFMDPESPQSQALAWLQEDPITLATGRSTQTVLERYALAVLYYTTAGPFWDNPFLSRRDVCTWNREVTEDLQKIETTKEWIEASFWGVVCAQDGDSIELMALAGSNLVGPLPWELILLTHLKFINLSGNALTGTITTRISELQRLEVIQMHHMNLTGPVPTSFSSSTWFLNLGTNLLTGSLPESWGTTMPALETVVLNANSLTGTLPTTLGQLSKLVSLQIFDNVLTGPLPSELGQLNSMVSLLVERNLLTGSVEGSLCSSSQEWIDLGADCAEIECPCCTVCCYDNQSQCDEMR